MCDPNRLNMAMEPLLEIFFVDVFTNSIFLTYLKALAGKSFKQKKEMRNVAILKTAHAVALFITSHIPGCVSTKFTRR